MRISKKIFRPYFESAQTITDFPTLGFHCAKYGYWASSMAHDRRTKQQFILNMSMLPVRQYINSTSNNIQQHDMVLTKALQHDT